MRHKGRIIDAQRPAKIIGSAVQPVRGSRISFGAKLLETMINENDPSTLSELASRFSHNFYFTAKQKQKHKIQSSISKNYTTIMFSNKFLASFFLMSSVSAKMFVGRDEDTMALNDKDIVRLEKAADDIKFGYSAGLRALKGSKKGGDIVRNT